MRKSGGFAAVDVGASSGRVVHGSFVGEELRAKEIYRFTNLPRTVNGALKWDIARIYRGTLTGLREAAQLDSSIAGIGIDTWAIDYGLLDRDGALIADPAHYRDARTEGVMESVHKEIGADTIYGLTGIQMLPFNTLYQLKATARSDLQRAHTLLLIPDLLAYLLTGSRVAEETNASTTQLYTPSTRGWCEPLVSYLDLPPRLLPPIVPPGTILGALTSGARSATGMPSAVVRTVGSHDTASAVVAVPAETDAFAYISCGTWSLVGLELSGPLITEGARQANFTNARGAFGTVRFLRNVMGLWLLQECLRWWRANDGRERSRLLASAAGLPAFRQVIDPDHSSFLLPGDMPKRIRDYCATTGQHVPQNRPALVRCILDSLALAYGDTLDVARNLTARDIEAVHLVGGGARNAVLCQLTADVCGLRVEAGPPEATAFGNLLVQASAAGCLPRDARELRRVVRRSTALQMYRPGGDAKNVRAARHLFTELVGRRGDI
jgi:rhamnulokinase